MTRELAKRVQRLEEKTGETEARLQLERNIREIQEYLYCKPEALERDARPIHLIVVDPEGNKMEMTDDEYERRFRKEGLRFVSFA